jgi:cbb3-type cytochrome oxidase maturation protein
VSSLLVTIPLTLLLAGVLVALVVRAARQGEFEDWEGPAARHLFDDDRSPELEASTGDEPASVQGRGQARD